MMMNMIDFSREQTNATIINCLNHLSQDEKCYSTKLEETCQLLKDKKVYVFAQESEIALVCFDHNPVERELADEDSFCGEPPSYFGEDGHRVSPVWQLGKTMELFRNRLEKQNIACNVWGVLLSDSYFFNAEDMVDVWNDMQIMVFDRLPNLARRRLKVNRKEGSVGYSMVEAMLNAAVDGLELPSDGEGKSASSDAEKQSKSSESEDDILTEDGFRRYMLDFIGGADGHSDSRVVEDLSSGGNDEQDGSDEDDDEDSDVDDFFSASGLPDSEISQNGNLSVQVTILPPIANPREELAKLVGCQDIKKHMDELLSMTRYNKLMSVMFPGSKQHEVSLHSIFFGRPGTGKTTVCKIFGSLLHEAGALSKGHVVVCNRGTFIGTLWGDEERSVRQVIEKARGGVLMIDEAYLLNGKNENDPGRMVIPLFMEILANEQERDIAVVLCGYKEPMKHLMELNPGLSSRFPNHFEFADFTIDELLEITLRRIEVYKYHFTRSAWDKYKQILSQAYQVRDPDTWGNARYIANQLERIYIQHANRCVKHQPADKRQMLALTTADIQPIDTPRQKPRIGFRS